MTAIPTILVTGGAGFIGANFVHHVLEAGLGRVVNLDRLTYAGNLDNLSSAADRPEHVFVQGDVCDGPLVTRLLTEFQPRAIVHFAAETHVDRSIDAPREFVRTNITGTFELLEATRAYWGSLGPARAAEFRLLHVSTDEVFGSLPDDGRFNEQSPYAPNSPYAASKAAADHLVRAYSQTYGLPTLTTHCSNNYGPYQSPEKLIPLTILNALEGRALPIYGDGMNVRDWLYVKDHCEAIHRVLLAGRPGGTYGIGAGEERTNLDVVRTICRILQDLAPASENPCLRDGRGDYSDLITFVPDRPGHDRRYALDDTRTRSELDWRPSVSFEDGLRRTVTWYLEHRTWCSKLAPSLKRRERLGLAARAPAKPGGASS